MVVHNPEQFHRAKIALEGRGLLSRFMNPDGIADLVTFGRHHPGWLWVDESRRDEAADILDELGIPNSINSRPIVDRSEPMCPDCGCELDPHGPEDCPNCGLEFFWVEIDEQAADS